MSGRITRSIFCTTLLFMPAAALAQHGHEHAPHAAAPADWRNAEEGILSDHVQLTFPTEYLKAGEAYFSPNGNWIIFQAIPVPPEGEEPDADYSMYLARLERDDSGNITGILRTMLLSDPGSANTCGFFHPTEKGRVIFGSTMAPPGDQTKGGYQRGESRYQWMFPDEMDIVTRFIPPLYYDGNPKITTDVVFTKEQLKTKKLFERNGYDAECGYSPDGRYIVHASVDPNTQDADLFVLDTTTGERTVVVEAEGYDGGPFFSPDGKRICYRSDRDGNDLLQLFVADLAFDEDGNITGIEREHQLTSNEHVNWCPFWHPSGRYMVYATSEVGHHNYEVFSIEVPAAGKEMPRNAMLAKRRITHASGFDGLPVFDTTGTFMMWTSQRGGKIEGEDRPSSQLWVARVNDLSPRADAPKSSHRRGE